MDGLAKMPQSPARSAVVAGAPDLERVAGGVLVGLLSGAVWMGTATGPAAKATTWTTLGCAVHTANRPDTVMIIVCAGA